MEKEEKRCIFGYDSVYFLKCLKTAEKRKDRQDINSLDMIEIK